MKRNKEQRQRKTQKNLCRTHAFLFCRDLFFLFDDESKPLEKPTVVDETVSSDSETFELSRIYSGENEPVVFIDNGIDKTEDANSKLK